MMIEIFWGGFNHILDPRFCGDDSYRLFVHEKAEQY